MDISILFNYTWVQVILFDCFSINEIKNKIIKDLLAEKNFFWILKMVTVSLPRCSTPVVVNCLGLLSCLYIFHWVFISFSLKVRIFRVIF
jgi:hypothetical protein